MDPAIRDALEVGELPLGVDIASDRLVGAVRTIVPPDWVQEQVEGALDEVTPYFTGERETFEVNVQLGGRVDVALAEVKALLRESDAYELPYDQVVEPQVTERFGAAVVLPLGVTVSTEEVLAALRQVAPVEWVGEQVEMVIDDAGPYLTGEVDHFTTKVSLLDNKRRAEGVLAELVESKMTGLAQRLPNCTSADQLQQAVRQVSQGQGLPSCVPAGVPTEQLLERLGIDVVGQVQSAVLGPVPNDVRFSDGQLRSALSLAGAGDNLEQVDDVRQILRDGWTYTQDDLKADLNERGDDLVDTLEDVRALLADGWTVTEMDLRENLSGDEPVTEPRKGLFFTAETPTEILDVARNWLKFVRGNRVVVYLPVIAVTSRQVV